MNEINTNLYVLHWATALFLIAILHTFLTKRLIVLSHFFKQGSISEKLINFLGEVEIVFGFWAFIFIIFLSLFKGTSFAVSYVNSVDYSEAVFVFVIMCMAATKPIIQFSKNFIMLFAKILPLSRIRSFYCAALIIGPLLGSFITEPAAMTIIALLLKEAFFDKAVSKRFKYVTLGLLFVNISIGGTLTHFAAPPILVISAPWSWGTAFMFKSFGWKSILIVTLQTFITAFIFKNEFIKIGDSDEFVRKEKQVPFWMKIFHLLFIIITVFFHDFISFYLALFLFFLGWVDVTSEYQVPLKIKESLLVGFFLGGLVTLGGLQGWWLKPVILNLSHQYLFLGTTVLTAFTDNAAITYLSTLVPNLSEAAKYAVVSGAIAGGGLTVIANAPNPSGYGILRNSFGKDGINPLGLFLGALPFTILTMLVFFLL